ncbi:formin-like protein 18 isoform X2 [Mercurialis annua]|uniref:formin-like protein 18 isoform X2 n=1 Tax=Mercurialis annua TaxID=3986 RepID=UPI002160E708|nr:formin-like protein 18 isoform X2 [Mercurialis annua]
MALFKKFFYRKPPDGLLEISERVYVFDCCFTTDVSEDDEYKVYIGGIVSQLRDQLPDSSFMVFNFREGERQSMIANVLSEYDMTVMDYPRHYEGCPLLTMEMIHHFLRSSESWLSLMKQNVILMHCERGGWPVLAFMLASLLIYRKQFTGEQKTLDMIYKQAPRELLQLMSPLNPLPSQLRYLQYISRRNVGSQWPPLDRALNLDCVILRAIPNMDGEGGCRPIFRIYGQDPLMVADRTPKVLFSTPKRSKLVRHYKQAVSDLIKIDIHCHIQGDVVMECVHVENDLEREQMMFRVMFNTAFIRSNILMLNREEIDMLWNVRDQFPKDFRAEALFSEMNSTSSLATVDLVRLEEKGGLSEDAFAKVQEFFDCVDLLPGSDMTLNILQQLNGNQKNLETNSLRTEMDNMMLESTIEKVQKESKNNISLLSNSSPDASSTREKVEPLQELQVAVQRPPQSKIISPRVQKALRSSPFGTPSTFGISALLIDHAAANSEDIMRQVTISPSAISSPITNVQKPMHHVSSIGLAPSPSPSPSPPPPPPLPPSSTSLNSERFSAISSSPSQQTSKSTYTHLSHCSEKFSETSKPLLGPACSQIFTSSPGPSPALAPDSSSSTLPPPPPPISPVRSSLPTIDRSVSMPPLSSPISFHGTPPSFTVKHPAPPPPPEVSSQQFMTNSKIIPGPPPPPPPPPLSSQSSLGPVSVTSVPSPPPPPGSAASITAVPPSLTPRSARTDFSSNDSAKIPPVPPPPAPFGKGLSKPCCPPLPSHIGVGNGNVPPVPGPPSSALFSAKGRGISRLTPRSQAQPKKANLKPYHWLKLTRAMQGSLWAETQKSDEASKAPEFDLSELESLFSAAAPSTGPGSNGEKSSRRLLGPKSDRVHLIELRRAYNCEIMLSKVKIPLSDLMGAILAMDDSVLDVDQVDNLIKFCPTKEEMELLKGYSGDKENLGKCEQFFLELMKVPRVESKLRVFSFKLQFHHQVSDLRKNLHIVNSAAEEVRSSLKLKRVMQAILSLGNALNHGTARGSAVGFRLDSLLKLTDTRAINNKMTLMHYLCKVLAEKLPELLDFKKDLQSLEAATKIQLKYLAEEMQAISKGLEKVLQELAATENDGPVSEYFCKILKAFLSSAESEVRCLASLYSTVGRNADALALYFGEDPARCPFEQVVSTLLNFVKMLIRAHDENCKQMELDRKRAAKEAEIEKSKMEPSKKDSETLMRTPMKIIKWFKTQQNNQVQP